ncbi:MAG: BrxE family protein [Armatimonadota bacterium]|nr:BrxE family protein [bacterium]
MHDQSAWARLAMIVARLGADPEYGWWKTDAATITGVSMMNRILPRTGDTAVVLTTAEAAARVHDSHVGSTSVFHLFRLPGSDGLNLEAMISNTEAQRREIKLISTSDREELRSLLAEIALSIPNEAGSGPVSLGSVNQSELLDMLSRLAGLYWIGFRDGKETYPYFVMDVK